MNVLYLDCGMGAAGDMLTAALLELFHDPQQLVDRLNALGLDGVRFQAERSVKCGITGTHMTVTVNGEEEETGVHPHHRDHDHFHDYEHDHEHAEHSHHHSHHGVADIAHIVNDHLALPERVKRDVLNVFGLIAEAESHVHGVPVQQIHFHEVGTMDAVADVTAVCYLLDTLAPDEIVASPVHTGCGQVACAHGILPVPAPATAYILRDVPIYGGAIKWELCTPTGAALLKYFVTRFGEMPPMRTRAIGYGMGKKDFEAANCVRAMLGTTEERTETVAALSCNVDDMTAEAIGYATEKLLAGGALDVYTAAVGMKKNRPGTLIHVLCKPEDRDRMAALLFLHTSTIGIRAASLDRYVLLRNTETLETSYGPVRKKTSSGYGVTRIKYEYEDLARIADARGCSIEEARRLLEDME